MGFTEAPAHPIELGDCWWYHSIDFPDGTQVSGDWDLRGRFADYTGHADFRGKRVMDVGTASGFLAFGAEQAGAASVVSFDMPVDGDWGTVPIASDPVQGLTPQQVEEHLRRRRLSEASRYKRPDALRQMRNGFFYAHRKMSSNVRLYEGSIYQIDESVGAFDVAIVGGDPVAPM